MIKNTSLSTIISDNISKFTQPKNDIYRIVFIESYVDTYFDEYDNDTLQYDLETEYKNRVVELVSVLTDEEKQLQKENNNWLDDFYSEGIQEKYIKMIDTGYLHIKLLKHISKQIELVEQKQEDVSATHIKPTHNFIWLSLKKLN
jgi:hypothetical protein|tara:strand:+ start:7104 stop:7538 length:435 start_codon:yes stop_codon:yes gene_type:complete